MYPSVPANAVSSHEALPAIPYLQQPPISGGHVLSVFLITAALLVALLAALALSRRAGWLSRFGIQGSPSAGRKEDTLRVLESTALGTGSRAFLLQAGNSRYLIVESTRQVSVREIASKHGEPHDSP